MPHVLFFHAAAVPLQELQLEPELPVQGPEPVPVPGQAQLRLPALAPQAAQLLGQWLLLVQLPLARLPALLLEQQPVPACY